MIGLFYGTRPEYIKLLPLLEALDDRGINYLLYQVTQHTDLIDNCAFDKTIKIGSMEGNRLNNIIMSIMPYRFENLDYVLVQGDTTTAAAVAISAFHQRIPVMHLEAGMRTYDKENPYPEEVNRRIISSIATIHYCPTVVEKAFLIREGFFRDDILVTGNTIIDNLRGMESFRTNKVLVTLHRRENHERMGDWFYAIESLAKENPEYKFIFPMHPNPKVQKYRNMLRAVQVCDPLVYDDMKEIIASCAAIITDSGGIQEEASYFKKPCFVCRLTTERPSQGSYLCSTPQKLRSTFSLDKVVRIETPFGDGNAGEKIAEDIYGRI